MTDIKETYDVFGKAVVDQVQLEVNRNSDLKMLLTRLNEEVPEQLDEQHMLLKKIITRYGPLFFLTVAKSDWTPEQVERMKSNLKAGLETPLPGTLRRLTPQSRASARGNALGSGMGTSRSATPKPESAPEPRKIYPSDRKQIVQPRSPYSAPSRHGDVAPQRRAQDRAAAPPARVLVDVPTYKGPDRRVLADRRVGPTDRRADLEMVYKNQRYGGRDRRKTVRRAADLAKQAGGGTDS
ncbi:MAG: hypothetical protein ACR2IE_09765 [Candidatus Sumerlaeaceae bacterium]